MKTALAILIGIDLATGNFFTALLCSMALSCMLVNEIYGEFEEAEEARHAARMAELDADEEARRARRIRR